MTIPDRRPSRADLGPVTREYVKSMGWRSVNFHTHISLVHRYVYVEVPKAGCGTMKATLGALEGARLNPTHAQRFQDKPHNGVKSGAHIRPYQLPVDLLEEVDGGDILLDGKVITDPSVDPVAVRKRLGFVFQLFHLVPYLTVRENILAGMSTRQARCRTSN